MRILLHWPSVGPYHTARVRGVLSAMPAGTEAVILATAGQVEDRPWAAPELPAGARLETAFPERNYPTLSRGEIKPRLREILDRWRPEVVAVSGYGMADSREVLRWAKRHSVPSILMSETKADDAPRRWYRELAKRYYVRQFGAGLCGGTPHRQYLEELGMPPERIFIKYDVVDNERFATQVAECRTKRSKDEETKRQLEVGGQRPEGGAAGSRGASVFRKTGDSVAASRPYFLASSRFIERKNLRRLIDAYAEYRRRSMERGAGSGEQGEQRPKSRGQMSEARDENLENGGELWDLVLLGTGPLREQMMRHVEREDIEGVNFAGFQQLEDLTGFYAGAGAFVHPALQEQWGLVVNEAMACGLPVLVSRTVGAAYDLVQDGVNGFRFDPRETGELSALLERLSAPDFPRAAFGEASRRIIADWTPEEFGENFRRAAEAAGWRQS